MSTETQRNNKKSKLSSNKLSTVNANGSSNKKVDRSSNKTAARTPGKVGKVKVAGKTVDFNSDKAQYLNLTIDQIQELALKQKNADFESAKESNEQSETNGGESQPCLLHNNNHKYDAKKFNTLPR